MLQYVSITFLWFGCVYPYAYDDTKRLTDTLFDVSRYRVDIKPVRNQSDYVKVNISHVLRAVTEVIVQNGYAVAELELEIKWKDEYLVWNTSEFNGMEKLSLLADTFWTPAVMVIDEIENDINFLENKYIPAWVTHDGIISIIDTASVKAKCIMDISEYPFDRQTCYMKTMSTVHGIEDVQIFKGQAVQNIEKNDLNKHWEIENVAIQAKPHFKGEYCFSSMVISFTIKRKITFLIYQIFILMSGMVLLNMLTPFVPPGSGERITLCITIFLSFIFTSDSVNDEIPDTTGASLVSICILIYNFLNIITVAWSVLIAHLYRRSGQVPVWLIRIMKVNTKPPKTSDISTKHPNTSDISDTDQTNDEPNDVSKGATEGDMETCGVESEVCVVTWQDVTKKMDKIYFCFFLVLYVVLSISAGCIAISKGWL